MQPSVDLLDVIWSGISDVDDRMGTISIRLHADCVPVARQASEDQIRHLAQRLLETADEIAKRKTS